MAKENRSSDETFTFGIDESASDTFPSLTDNHSSIAFLCIVHWILIGKIGYSSGLIRLSRENCAELMRGYGYFSRERLETSMRTSIAMKHDCWLNDVLKQTWLLLTAIGAQFRFWLIGVWRFPRILTICINNAYWRVNEIVLTLFNYIDDNSILQQRHPRAIHWKKKRWANRESLKFSSSRLTSAINLRRSLAIKVTGNKNKTESH